MMDKDKDGNRTVGDTLYSCRIFDGCDTTLEPWEFGRKITKIQKKKKKEEVSSFALMFFVTTKSSLVLIKSIRKISKHARVARGVCLVFYTHIKMPKTLRD